MFFCVLALFSIFELARAATVTRDSEQATTILSSVQIESFKPYSIYAAAAYCPPSTTLSWSCGANCARNPRFQPYASGGDGSATQFWYVGWDPTLSSVIVAHQGTDPIQFLADLTDLDFFLQGLDPTLFPGLPPSIQVHQGFANEHAKTAPKILASVLTLLNRYNASSVAITGHSLGAALALLDSVYLPLHLPAGTYVRMVGYGMPRVGNSAFADYVDGVHSADGATATVTHINNKKDPIAIIPGRFMGFGHPAGEVHIQDDPGNSWVACPGHDNPSPLCSVGDVPNMIQNNLLDHIGPYDDGIFMGLC